MDNCRFILDSASGTCSAVAASESNTCSTAWRAYITAGSSSEDGGLIMIHVFSSTMHMHKLAAKWDVNNICIDFRLRINSVCRPFGMIDTIINSAQRLFSGRWGVGIRSSLVAPRLDRPSGQSLGLRYIHSAICWIMSSAHPAGFRMFNSSTPARMRAGHSLGGCWKRSISISRRS